MDLVGQGAGVYREDNYEAELAKERSLTGVRLFENVLKKILKFF